MKFYYLYYIASILMVVLFFFNKAVVQYFVLSVLWLCMYCHEKNVERIKELEKKLDYWIKNSK